MLRLNLVELSCVLGLSLLSFAHAAITIKLAAPDVVRRNLERGLVPAKDRQGTVRALFQAEGCAPEEQQVTRSSANVICRLGAESDSVIIVGAHFDFVDRGKGMVDDWSGSALLPLLYQALQTVTRKHTFIFASFAEEETGLKGSTRFVKELTADQRSHVRAFINLECLGLGKTNVWPSRATPLLLTKFVTISKALHEEVRGVDVERVGDDDSHPFLSAHLPVITLHSLTQETWPVLHSARDAISAIRIDDYYASYRLAAFYLVYLDSQLP